MEVKGVPKLILLSGDYSLRVVEWMRGAIVAPRRFWLVPMEGPDLSGSRHLFLV